MNIDHAAWLTDTAQSVLRLQLNTDRILQTARDRSQAREGDDKLAEALRQMAVASDALVKVRLACLELALGDLTAATEQIERAVRSVRNERAERADYAIATDAKVQSIRTIAAANARRPLRAVPEREASDPSLPVRVG